MKKTIILRLEPAKETRFSHRYTREVGDLAVGTLYLRKRDLDGKPPTRLTLTVEGS